MTDAIPPDAMNEIIELIRDNQKLEAVKRYKDLRGTSLLAAKNFIEELTERLRQESPETFVATPDLEEIRKLIYAGQKLEAIKRYREARATSLYDAKQFIEQLTDDLKQKSPEKFSIRSTTGCAGVLALVSITLATAVTGLIIVLNLKL